MVILFFILYHCLACFKLFKVRINFSALDDDDVAVLDLIAHTGGDLSRPRCITGSAAREPSAEEYSLEGTNYYI